MITLVDFPGESLHALEGALGHLGRSHLRAARPAQAAPEGPILLRGAGDFEASCAALKESGWWFDLPQMLASGRPVLGLGLGFHLLAEGSEASPKGSGLALLPGIARSLGPGVRLPHRGWAQVERHRDHPRIPDPRGAWMFFDHAQALDPGGPTLLAAHHGRPFAVMDLQGICVGVQADLCRSGAFGLGFLDRILECLGEAPEASRPPEVLN
jgi:imidazole glycerol-phosphate synthase subunit HisH